MLMLELVEPAQQQVPSNVRWDREPEVSGQGALIAGQGALALRERIKHGARIWQIPFPLR